MVYLLFSLQYRLLQKWKRRDQTYLRVNSNLLHCTHFFVGVGLILVRFQIVNMDSSDIFQDTGPDGGVEEYEEELTAAEVLQKLEDAWLNEKHSPELLEPKMEIVECMLEQVNS